LWPWSYEEYGTEETRHLLLLESDVDVFVGDKADLAMLGVEVAEDARASDEYEGLRRDYAC
jgi:hypothetical protein